MKRGQRGAAVVDFVLVAVILVPLALGIAQLALVLYVRNLAAAAASEGARSAAVVGHTPRDGEATAREQLAGGLAGRYAGRIDADRISIDGAPGVEVTIHVMVPALGLGGPGVSFAVAGHAVEEPR